MMFGSDKEALSYAQEVCLAPFHAPYFAVSVLIVHACMCTLQMRFSWGLQLWPTAVVVVMLMFSCHDAEGVACEGRQNLFPACRGQVSPSDAIKGAH